MNPTIPRRVPAALGDPGRPVYRRLVPRRWSAPKPPASTPAFIDLEHAHIEEYGASVAEAAAGFDARAAAAVSAAVGLDDQAQADGLLEVKYGGTDNEILVPTAKCLAVLAYPDYLPLADADAFRLPVSDAIMRARAGWCGSFGPGVDGSLDVADVFGDHEEGNYDMSQLHLAQIAYRHYDDLKPDARERLVRVLLGSGRIRRPNQDDIVTSGGAPNDWSRAGFMEVPLPVVGDLLGIHVKVKRIGETENHILAIHTARYLANQLLWQRDHDPQHDNRRNHSDDAPSCTALMLGLLANILRGDFSEYNAKNYQNETRSALLNLCSYAYDHEVRLSARMVLDYLSARVAVSSNDLRRMVPFRRRNVGKNVALHNGYMNVSLLETAFGSDPMPQRFAVLAGNTRAHASGRSDPPRPWTIRTDGANGNEAVADALAEYRIPPSIHDLFVTDAHRRYFQRLRRTPQDDVEVTGRNVDNHEVYAGSPSYLITAGGSPASHAIDPSFAGVVIGDQDQQLGVAVTTSFMPTGFGADALELIQFSWFSQRPGKLHNHGVAPDFACGHRVHLPPWCEGALDRVRPGRFDFFKRSGGIGRPGFYLAFLRDGEFTAMEALDTWLHPEVDFEAFKTGVQRDNAQLGERGLQSNVESVYTTQGGSRIRFVIWQEGQGEGVVIDGANVTGIEYGERDPVDGLGDAGNSFDRFLSGSVMNGTGDGLVEVGNPFLGTTIALDLRDASHPRRTDESGAVEEAGSGQEIWVDFARQGAEEGDFYRPFASVAAAVAAAAEGGTIRFLPGSTADRTAIPGARQVRLVAPLGGVTIGRR